MESLERRLALDASAALNIVADVATTVEDQPVEIDVLANDSGAGLEITEVIQGEGGVAEITNEGTITFTPDADFNGTATFEYQATDNFGNEATGEVTVEVEAENDAPFARDDLASAVPGGTITFEPGGVFDVLANDFDVDGDELTITEVTDVVGGTAEVNEDGTITFTADSDLEGDNTFEAIFTYTIEDPEGAESTGFVTVVVDPNVVNNAPPEVMDDVIDEPILEDGSTTIDVADLLENDTDALPENGELTIISVGNAVGGEAVLNDDGTITFTAEPDFSGDASFEYTVRDDWGLTSTGTVSVTVEAVNDAPVLDLNGEDEGVDFSTEYTPGDDPVLVAPDLVVSDDGEILFATVELTNVSDEGEETLAVDMDLAADLGIEVNADEEGVLVLTGPATAEEFAQLLATLSYENTADEPTAGERTIEVSLVDVEGETAMATSTVDVLDPSAEPDSSWFNADEPFDVNDDGEVNVRDLLAVVRFLIENGRGPLDAEDAPPVDPETGEIDGGYVDVNNDGEATIADLVAVARNMRSRGHGGGNGVGQGHGNVPRPDRDDNDDDGDNVDNEDQTDDDDADEGPVGNNGNGNGNGRPAQVGNQRPGRGLAGAIDDIAEDVARSRSRGNR